MKTDRIMAFTIIEVYKVYKVPKIMFGLDKRRLDIIKVI